MRRFFSIVFALVKIAALAAVAFWVYLHPGDIVINWEGLTIKTSVGFAAFVVALAMFAFAVIYHGWRLLLAWPRLWSKQRQVKAMEMGYKALNKGLLAVAGNDAATASKQTKKALSLLPDAALTHLLAAQTAQMNGDDIAADTHLAKLAAHADGQLFGLRGQLTRAMQRDDFTEALRLSRMAYAQQPSQPWIIDAAVQLEARQRNWIQVEKILRHAVTLNRAEQDRWKRDLGAALLAISDDAKSKNDLEAALECAREALKRNPGWTPAALRVADLWHRKAYRRRAQKTLQNAWDIAPHPELVAAWVSLASNERNSDAASTIEKLIGGNSDNAESALAMADVYRRAGLWGVARQQAMKALEYRTDRSIYRLLADIEHGDTGDTKKVRAWLEKAADADAEPQWICTVTHDRFDSWQVLNHRGNFDTIEWNMTPQTLPTIAPPANVVRLAV